MQNTDPGSIDKIVPPSPNSKLFEALAKAQAEITPPAKTHTVDFIDKNGRRVYYKYADLADLIECLKPLSKHGIAVTHQLDLDQAGFGMVTSLHFGEEEVTTWYPLPNPVNMKPQEFGSALTYARRYSLSLLTGVASEEDDDGNDQDKTQAPPKKDPPAPPLKITKPAEVKPPAAKGTDGRISVAQRARMHAIGEGKGWDHEKIRTFILEAWNFKSTDELTDGKYQWLCQTMEQMSFSDAMNLLKKESKE